MSELGRFWRPETAKIEAEKTEQEMASELHRDFWLSFKYGQNVLGVQGEIQKGIMDHPPYNNPDTYNQYVELATRLDFREGFRLPRTHAEVSQDFIEAQFERWSFGFCNILGRQHDPERRIPVNFRRVVAQVAEQDANYAKKGRPNARDPYASFFREYILGGRPAGSPAYDGFFRSVKEEFLATPDLQQALLATNLIENWEERHNGQSFLDVLED